MKAILNRSSGFSTSVSLPFELWNSTICRTNSDQSVLQAVKRKPQLPLLVEALTFRQHWRHGATAGQKRCEQQYFIDEVDKEEEEKEGEDKDGKTGSTAPETSEMTAGKSMVTSRSQLQSCSATS